MPLLTTLLQVPNQSLDAVIEADAYTIDLTTYKGLTYISLERNGEQLLTGKRVAINEPILLFNFQFNDHGNFQFASNLPDYPFFEQFGVSVFFIYNTKAEVEASGV